MMLTYLVMNLGRRDDVYSAKGLAFGGILCIGLAIPASYGLSALIGQPYTPLHGSLPLLILGLGVDDMFIIVSEYHRVGITNVGMSIEDKLALTMQHAGVSIMITSLTDVVAFTTGAVTIIPALSSFCAFAAMGVLCTFFFVCTF